MGLVKSSPMTLPSSEASLPPGTPLIGYHSIVTSANISANKQDVNFPASNLANPATNQEWHSASAATSPDSPDVPVEITVANGLPATLDYVAIAGHNFGTAGITVSLLDNASSTLIAGFVPTNDDPIIMWFTPTTTASVKIRLVPGASNMTARAAVVYVGKLLVCERGFDVDANFNIPRFGRRTEVVQGKNSRGDYLGRIVLSTFLDGITVVFEHFTPDWYRSKFDPFLLEAQQDVPFFFAWNPLEYPLETAYCWLTDDPDQLTNPVTRRQQIQLKMGGFTS